MTALTARAVRMQTDAISPETRPLSALAAVRKALLLPVTVICVTDAMGVHDKAHQAN